MFVFVLFILVTLKKYIPEINIDGAPLEYRLIKRRGHRSFTLSVHRGGRVILTVPKYVTEKNASKFIVKKETWLRSAIRNAPKEDAHSGTNREEYVIHKERARNFVQNRLRELNEQYGFVYNQVRIRMNTSRWGSCSAQGNLNFDYRILFLPEHAQDYLLVHELCHLQELNHSERFWVLVSKTIPNYKQVRKLLKRRNIS